METKLVCFNCSHEMTFVGLVGRREVCPQCRSDVHVCKNCEHHDVKVYNECRENSAEVVREKDRSNFCDFFGPRRGGLGGVDKSAALRAAAEALFKKS
jgi:hypothetical protein